MSRQTPQSTGVGEVLLKSMKGKLEVGDPRALALATTDHEIPKYASECFHVIG
jgi:hypothetical protein